VGIRTPSISARQVRLPADISFLLSIVRVSAHRLRLDNNISVMLGTADSFEENPNRNTEEEVTSPEKSMFTVGGQGGVLASCSEPGVWYHSDKKTQ
jgi:translation elongation factor EF-Tu-like GTPase